MQNIHLDPNSENFIDHEWEDFKDFRTMMKKSAESEQDHQIVQQPSSKINPILHWRYLKQQKYTPISITQVAELFAVTKTTVYKWLRETNLTATGKPKLVAIDDKFLQWTERKGRIHEVATYMLNFYQPEPQQQQQQQQSPEPEPQQQSNLWAVQGNSGTHHDGTYMSWNVCLFPTKEAAQDYQRKISTVLDEWEEYEASYREDLTAEEFSSEKLNHVSTLDPYAKDNFCETSQNLYYMVVPATNEAPLPQQPHQDSVLLGQIEELQEQVAQLQAEKQQQQSRIHDLEEYANSLRKTSKEQEHQILLLQQSLAQLSTNSTRIAHENGRLHGLIADYQRQLTLAASGVLTAKKDTAIVIDAECTPKAPTPRLIPALVS